MNTRKFNPLAPYVYSSEFDWVSYLEQDSHFARVTDTIDRGVARLVCSNEALTSRIVSQVGGLRTSTEDISHQLTGIENALSSGFHELSGQLRSIEASIDNLTASVERGFHEMSLGLCGIQSTLDELLEVAKNPEQTWAFEQFAVAQDLYQRGLYSDALQYTELAIEGRGERLGYRFDHRPYMLRGLIFLGNGAKPDQALVDLDKAFEAFNVAATYASQNPNETRSIRNYKVLDGISVAKREAMCLAAWTDYCRGNVEQAAIAIKKVQSEFPKEAKPFFYGAKYSFDCCEADSASHQLGKAIGLDPLYAIQVSYDASFLANKDVCTAVIQKARDAQQVRMEGRAKNASKALGHKLTLKFGNNNEDDQQIVSQVIQKIPDINQGELGLLELKSLVPLFKSFDSIVKTSLKRAIGNQRDHRSFPRAVFDERNAPQEDRAVAFRYAGRAILKAQIVSYLLVAAIIGYAVFGNSREAFGILIIGIVAGLWMGFQSTTEGWPFSWIRSSKSREKLYELFEERQAGERASLAKERTRIEQLEQLRRELSL